MRPKVSRTVERLLVLGSMAVAPVEAGAQQPAPMTIQQFVLTPGYQANVARLFSALPPDVFQRCPALVSRGSSVTVVEPAIFAADGYPTAGLWRQAFPVSGCGNDTTINFFFKARPDEKVASIVAAPGSTRAGLQLQRDAIGYATIAVNAVASGCQTIHVRDTAYRNAAADEASGSAGRGQPWSETWTMSACGRSYDVPITFIPDATGTTIRAAPARAVER